MTGPAQQARQALGARLREIRKDARLTERALGERRIWPSTGFWIFDQNTVRVETPSAELTITQRGEIAVFEKRFAWLQESAVYGREARKLITAGGPG